MTPRAASPREVAVDDRRRLTRRVAGGGVLALVLLVLFVALPYAAGIAAEKRVRALITKLDTTSGAYLRVRLTRYDRGIFSTDATLSVSLDVPGFAEDFEVPFSVGHGPVPLVDVLAGRSAMRFCAGFASFDSSRGRGPGGVKRLPLRGRVVFGFLGGLQGELGIRAEDLRPATTLGKASPARITLTGDVSAFTLEGYLAEWIDRHADAPSIEIGGLLASLTVSRASSEYRFEVAHAAYIDGDDHYAIEQYRATTTERGSGTSARKHGETRVALFRVEGAEDYSLTIREPTFSYSYGGSGANEGTIALSLASYAGPDGALGPSSIRGSLRVSAVAVRRLGEAITVVLEGAAPADAATTSPSAAAPTPAVAPDSPEARERAFALFRGLLFGDDDDSRIIAIEARAQELLRTAPSVTLDVNVVADDRAPLVVGRIAVRLDPARAAGTARVLAVALEALVIDVDATLSRSLIAKIARLEVERRAAALVTADDAERRDALVLDVVSGAIEAHAIEARGEAFHVVAMIPVGTPAAVTLAGRTMDTYAATSLGLALRRAEMPRVRVALGAVVSTGDITDGNVIIAIAPRARDLRLCGESQLLDAPPTLEGDVQIRIDVAPTGIVRGSQVLTNSLADESLGECLSQVLRALPLPVTRRGGASVVPIHITRGSEPSLDNMLESMGGARDFLGSDDDAEPDPDDAELP